MGTRNLVCVLVDGEIRVAQYGQWDGYPSGQGTTVLNFVQSIVEDNDVNAFADRVRNLKTLSHDEVDKIWRDIGADENRSISMEVSNAAARTHPELSRDTGGRILELINNGDVENVFLSTEFAHDSLFCEYAYVVNLDTQEIEVFRGFQRAPHSQGRFAEVFPRHFDESHRTNKYYAVAEIIRFSFHNLPDSVEFVEKCEQASPYYSPTEEEDFTVISSGPVTSS